MKMGSFFVIFIVLLSVNALTGSSLRCDLILRDVPGNGIGVFSGRDWYPTELMEIAVGIPVPYESLYWTQLINYCEGYNETHALLTLGYSLLYNHRANSEQSMLQRHMVGDLGLVRFHSGNEQSIDVYLEPNAIVFAGDEIYTHYGDDWFADRDEEEVTGNQIGSYSVTDRETSERDILAAQNHPHNLPGCPLQLTEYVEGILRAAVDISAGTVIEVARALLLPAWALSDTSGPINEIVWWGSNSIPDSSVRELEVKRKGGTAVPVLHTRESRLNMFGSPYHVAPYNRSESGYALLLLGRGSLYSPSISENSGGPSESEGNHSVKNTNVAYSWWNVQRDDQKDIECSLTMLVAYTTSQDIAMGEELVVPLTMSKGARKYAQGDFANHCL